MKKEVAERAIKSLRNVRSLFEKRGDLEKMAMVDKAIEETGKGITEDDTPELKFFENGTPPAIKIFNESSGDIKVERNVDNTLSRELIEIIKDRPLSNMRSAIELFSRRTGEAKPKEMLFYAHKNAEKGEMENVDNTLFMLYCLGQRRSPLIPVKMIEKDYIPFCMGCEIIEYAYALFEENTIYYKQNLLNYFDKFTSVNDAEKEIEDLIKTHYLQINEDKINLLARSAFREERMKLLKDY